MAGAPTLAASGPPHAAPMLPSQADVALHPICTRGPLVRAGIGSGACIAIQGKRHWQEGLADAESGGVPYFWLMNWALVQILSWAQVRRVQTQSPTRVHNWAPMGALRHQSQGHFRMQTLVLPAQQCRRCSRSAPNAADQLSAQQPQMVRSGGKQPLRFATPSQRQKREVKERGRHLVWNEGRPRVGVGDQGGQQLHRLAQTHLVCTAWV